jgi:hypothetical protein
MGLYRGKDDHPMTKRISKEEILRTLRVQETRCTAVRLFAESLSPPAGWRFVESPKGFSAFLIHVDCDGYINHYDVGSLGSQEGQLLQSELLRAAEEQQNEHESLFAAFHAWEKYRARVAGIAAHNLVAIPKGAS